MWGIPATNIASVLFCVTAGCRYAGCYDIDDGMIGEKKMKKNNGMKKWKLLIIVVWILFLAASGIGCVSMQRSAVFDKAKTELTNQAEIVSRQFTSLVDTNFYARGVFYDRLIPEVKAISFVLENYDDIDQAKGFLENIVSTTEIKNLWIYDRKGNILFRSGAAPEPEPEPNEISSLLDSKAYELIESNFDENDRYQSATYLLENNSNDLLWGVKDRWLIYAKDILSDELQDVVQFFNWDQTLQDVSVSRGGTVLAVSETEGLVLSYSDASARGKPVEELNIKLPGEKTAATADRLLNAFSQTGEITKIEVDSVPCYATRMNIDKDLFLLMCPAEAIEKEVWLATVILMAPLLIITGIGVLYAFCLTADDLEQLKQAGERKGGLKVSTGKLKVFAILAVVLVFVVSAYLETHFIYSRMFQYTSTTAEEVLQKKILTDAMLKELNEWQQKGNLEKSRIARSGIQYAPEGKLDRQYVSDLADRLKADALYVFDKQGKVSLTNAPYDGYVIGEDSPLHVLLEGADSVVLQPDQKKTSDEVRQEAGVTMIDDSNRVAGAVVIANSTIPLSSDSLSYDNVFQRVFLKDDSVVIAVDSNNMTIQYFAQVDGSLIVSDQYAFDYSQIDAAELGLDKNLIKDHFNGEMFVINNQYFASVRRSDDAFLMVMHPLVFIDSGNLLSALYVTVAALLFFIVLTCMTGRFEKLSEEVLGEIDRQEAEKEKAKSSPQDPDEDKAADDMIVVLERLAHREKYGFEKRWPSDGKKWKDKTPMEKYSTAVKLICFTAFVLLVVRVVVAGKDSILYYSFNGEWNSGINLYSITSGIISIILLFLLREIIHKILYLIARAASSKGETICHLLNSFTGYILFIAGVFIILGTLGVDVTTLSLTGGVAGVIFGIGCQNIVSDILAGIIMAFEGVACAGDFVSFNGKLGTIQSIGIRTTRLKWFGEITLVRNNEFKNYINMPAEDTTRVTVDLSIDLRESITRIESIIEKELPVIRDAICETTDDSVKLKYRGVQSIGENGKKLGFAIYCKGMNYGWIRRLLNRELLLMCERNGIQLAMPQIVINEPADVHKDFDEKNGEKNL